MTNRIFRLAWNSWDTEGGREKSVFFVAG